MTKITIILIQTDNKLKYDVHGEGTDCRLIKEVHVYKELCNILKKYSTPIVDTIYVKSNQQN